MGMAGGAQNGQMNPLMLMLLMDDKTKKQCDSKYEVDYTFKIAETSTGVYSITKITSNIRDIFTTTVIGHPDENNSKWAKNYAKCLNDADKEGDDKSTMDKLLPLMLMGGDMGQGMDPMMMMLLADKI